MGVMVERVDGVEAGEHRPHEALVVIVVADVDDRLPPGELRRGREVGRSVQGLVCGHVHGNVQYGVERPPAWRRALG